MEVGAPLGIRQKPRLKAHWLDLMGAGSWNGAGVWAPWRCLRAWLEEESYSCLRPIQLRPLANRAPGEFHVEKAMVWLGKLVNH